MGQLYLNEYIKHLVGKRVCIGCREGILRDNFSEIIADIKFLTRNGIKTTLFHNLPNRFANQKLLTTLEKKLSETTITRIAPDESFYAAVLAHPETKFKVIFLERRYLIDNKGHKINTLTTDSIRNSLDDFAYLFLCLFPMFFHNPLSRPIKGWSNKPKTVLPFSVGLPSPSTSPPATALTS